MIRPRISPRPDFVGYGMLESQQTKQGPNIKPNLGFKSGSNPQTPPKRNFGTSDQQTLEKKTVLAERQKRSANILVDAARDFGDLKRPTSMEITKFKELFYQLIDRLSVSDRRMISAILARVIFTPRAVALYFAQDKLEVAAPFLLFSPALGDLDLRAIAKKKGKQYAEIIIRRQNSLDQHTRSTLTKIIEDSLTETSSNTDQTIPTISANDVPETETWLDSSEIVALAGSGGKLGQKNTSRPVSTARKGPTAQAKLSLPKSDTRKLLKLARQQDKKAIARFISDLSGLKIDDISKLLNASSGDEVVYLVKALGIQVPHDIQFVLMVAPRIGRSVETYRATKALLADLDIGICRIIFNEIGAKFELNEAVSGHRPVQNEPSTRFQDAARKRRDAFEQQPVVQPVSQRSRFSFEASLMATG